MAARIRRSPKKMGDQSVLNAICMAQRASACCAPSICATRIAA